MQSLKLNNNYNTFMHKQIQKMVKIFKSTNECLLSFEIFRIMLSISPLYGFKSFKLLNRIILQ